jgi:hypothetical protein
MSVWLKGIHSPSDDGAWRRCAWSAESSNQDGTATSDAAYTFKSNPNKTTYDTFAVEQMYVGLFVIAIIGFLISLALNELERVIIPWKAE